MYLRYCSARVWAAALLLGPLPWVVGCGESTPSRPVGKLEGKVTLDGQPVRIGSITAISLDEESPAVGQGVIDDNGDYVIEKAPAGGVRLYLDLPPLPEQIDPALKRTPLAPGENVNPPGLLPAVAYLKDYPPEEQRLLLTVVNIPKHYLSRNKSPVIADVQENGTTKYNVKLSPKSWVPPDPEELANPELNQPDLRQAPPPP